MVKKQEELNVIKEEIETVGEKIKELTEEKLAQVSGGTGNPAPKKSGSAVTSEDRYTALA